mmetsp:Transcript_30456/g.69242  ORF Transcript_30456/g.69242 Transcript_30456/m.69242 type:complete len:214 (+) Transcript_30456:139-780(+)
MHSTGKESAHGVYAHGYRNDQHTNAQYGVSQLIPETRPGHCSTSDSLRRHSCCFEDGSIVVDGLDGHPVLIYRYVVEAVLALAVPVPLVEWVRCCLGANATTSTRDEAGKAAQPGAWMVRYPELLVMAMASDQEVEALLVQPSVEALLMAAGEVRHGNLPVCMGLGELLVHPGLLISPELLEERLAGVDGRGPVHAGAVGVRRVEGSPADVVV